MKEQPIVLGAFRIDLPLSVVRRATGEEVLPAERFQCVVVPTLFYYHSTQVLEEHIKYVARIKFVHMLHRRIERNTPLRRTLARVDWMVEQGQGEVLITPAITEELRAQIAAEMVPATPARVVSISQHS